MATKDAKAARKKALDEERRVMTWVLAWKNVKAGTKYNKCIRSATLGKINSKDKVEKFRWCALYSNCIVEYSMKTEPVKDDLSQSPHKWYRLEKFTSADGKVMRYDAKTREEAHEWQYAVKKAAATYNEAHKEITSIPNAISQVESTFTFPTWQAPIFSLGTVESMRGWVEKMGGLVEKHKVYYSYLLKLRKFADLVYSHGPYTDWFCGDKADDGIGKKIERAVRAGLSAMHKQAVTCYDECKAGFEKSFFLEDLLPVIDRGTFGIETVNISNELRKLLDVGTPEDLDIKAVMQALIDYFRKLPNANQVNFNAYEGGMVVSGEEKWMVDRPSAETKELKVHNKTTPTLPTWTARGFETVSDRHGSAIWNRVSWVWFHPRLRFTIRYNWKVKERVFQFHPGDQGKWILGQVLLPDWKWTGNGLVPLERKAPGEKKKGLQPVKVFGPVPVPTALLVAMMSHIFELVRDHLGILADSEGKQ